MKLRIPFLNRGPLVAVVRLSGVISADARGGLSDAALAGVLKKAFTAGKPSAVALLINSPGGSPVQSSLIAARIRRLSEEEDVPVVAFVEDVAASGGYWLATAADEIHVDQGSILGSIGVISAGFGAHVFLARQGIERRVHTAGDSKAMLDPFSEEKPEDIRRLRRMLDQLHVIFIDHVKSARGARLGNDPELFSGEVYIGQHAVDTGLADGIGHLVPVMKARFGEKTRFKVHSAKRGGLLRRLVGAAAHDAVALIDERAAYARFGL